MMGDIFKKPDAAGWHVIWMYVLFLMILWKLSNIQNSIETLSRNTRQILYSVEQKSGVK